MMALGVLVTGITYALMLVAAQLWQFYVVFGTRRAVAGPALIGVVPNTALANWFRRKRGRAMGLLAMCIPLGNGLLVLLGQRLIDTSGWRTVFVVLAVITLALVVPMAMVVRDSPEAMGLLPDGAGQAPPNGAGRPTPSAEEPSWTLRQATRTPALWLIAVAGCLATTANAGITFHQVAYFTDHGIPPLDAVISLAAFSLTGALAAVVWGYLTERLPERELLAVTFLLAAGAVLYLLSVRTLLGALVFAVLFGLTSRGGSTLLNIIVAEYFGRAAYGTISGFVQPFSMAGLAVGPLLASITFDLTGSYAGMFLGYAGSWAVGAGCLWLAAKPANPTASRVAVRRTARP